MGHRPRSRVDWQRAAHRTRQRRPTTPSDPSPRRLTSGYHHVVGASCSSHTLHGFPSQRILRPSRPSSFLPLPLPLLLVLLADVVAESRARAINHHLLGQKIESSTRSRSCGTAGSGWDECPRIRPRGKGALAIPARQPSGILLGLDTPSSSVRRRLTQLLVRRRPTGLELVMS